MLLRSIYENVDLLKDGLPGTLVTALVLGVHEISHILVAKELGIKMGVPFFVPSWQVRSSGNPSWHYMNFIIVLHFILSTKSNLSFRPHDICLFCFICICIFLELILSLQLIVANNFYELMHYSFQLYTPTTFVQWISGYSYWRLESRKCLGILFKLCCENHPLDS